MFRRYRVARSPARQGVGRGLYSGEQTRGGPPRLLAHSNMRFEIPSRVLWAPDLGSGGRSWGAVQALRSSMPREGDPGQRANGNVNFRMRHTVSRHPLSCLF